MTSTFATAAHGHRQPRGRAQRPSCRHGIAAGGGAHASPTRPASPSREPRALPRTYRRRRAAAGAMAGVVLAAVLTIVGAAVSGTLAGPGGVPASATGAQPSFTRTTIVVRSGDTLWSIAQVHRGEVPHDRYLHELVLLNGGAAIQAGQRLLLP